MGADATSCRRPCSHQSQHQPPPRKRLADLATNSLALLDCWLALYIRDAPVGCSIDCRIRPRTERVGAVGAQHAYMSYIASGGATCSPPFRSLSHSSLAPMRGAFSFASVVVHTLSLLLPNVCAQVRGLSHRVALWAEATTLLAAYAIDFNTVSHQPTDCCMGCRAEASEPH